MNWTTVLETASFFNVKTGCHFKSQAVPKPHSNFLGGKEERDETMARDLQKHWTVVSVDALHVTETTNLAKAWKDAEEKVKKVVLQIIRECKSKNRKFSDESFGSTAKDKDGAFSFYGDGKQPNANYANPADCVWVRPKYTEVVETLREEINLGYESSDEEDHEDADSEDGNSSDDYSGTATEAFFCEKGELFVGGVNANDVIQGKLGDCWLLSAMGVLATRADLIEKVFWGSNCKNTERRMRKYGIRVCRFFKDSKWYFVIMDDTLPVFAKSKKPVFAHSKDENELWVCFLEKAYAKLHLSYDALIGGYIDGALRDLTGLACQELVLREGHPGFHIMNKEDLENGNMWNMFDRYLNEWGCMMGCSIQPDPQSSGSNSTVEQKIGSTGLMMRHAYSLIDVGEIKTKNGPVKLLRIRNPWGFGEWTGAWSDTSQEFQTYKEELDKTFSGPICKRKDGIISTAQKVEANSKDGTFFMDWEDWKKYFTVIFAAVDFPEEWAGQKLQGSWTTQTAGGNNTQKTWVMNPTHRLKIVEQNTTVFFSLCQADPRATQGKNQFKFLKPIGFHIVEIKTGEKMPDHPPSDIPGTPKVPQQVYKLHLSIDMEVEMSPGIYTVVPSCYFQGQPGEYFLHVYSNHPIALEGGTLIAEEEEDNGKYEFLQFSDSDPAPSKVTTKEIKSRLGFEEFKTQLIKDLASVKLSTIDLQKAFKGKPSISWDQWKKALGKLSIKANKNAFASFSGDDNLLDSSELERLVQAEKEDNRLFGTGQSVVGDEAIAPNDASEETEGHLGMDPSAIHKLAHAMKELQEENDELRSEIDLMREEQARMMHVLLLYGKMLKCYEGPVHDAKSLLKVSKRESRQFNISETWISNFGSKSTISRPKSKDKQIRSVSTQRNFMESNFKFVETAGDEFMAVKPWKGAIKAPSKIPSAGSVGNMKLNLEWAFAYNCARNGIFDGPEGMAVTYTAAVGIIYDTRKQTQKFFLEHTDDIVCMDMKGSIAVTGQEGKKPFACAWDTSSGKLISKLDAYAHEREISCVALSQDGSQVLTIGGDDKHTMALYDTHSGKLLASSRGEKSVCLFAVHTGKRFVTGGVRHILFWDDKDMSKKGKPGKFSNFAGGTPQTLPCGISAGDSSKEFVITGAESGAILVWTEDKRCVFATEPDAHNSKAVEALHYDDTKKILLSGGKSGSCVTWSFQPDSGKLEKTAVVKKDGPVRCITPSRVGLANGDVFEGESLVFSGHSSGELWALATMDKGRCVTAGDDGHLNVWSTSEHKRLANINLPLGPARAVAYCPKSALIAVGAQQNCVTLYNADTLAQVASTSNGSSKEVSAKQKGKKKFSRADKMITCIAFSPSGDLIAFGSNDTTAHVLDAKTLKTKAVFKSSSGTVTHLDWSADSKFLRTNDGSYELLFYDVGSKTQVTSATAMKDTDWSTLTCPLTWHTQGIWPPEADGTDVNSVASIASKYIASSDDNGLVNVFPFPFPERKAEEIIVGKGHSSHVTSVTFISEKTLVSTGGRDRSTLVWSLS